MDKNNDSIEKLDEQIRKLKERNEKPVEVKKEEASEVIENKSLEDTDTKIFDGEEVLEDDTNNDGELLEELLETKKTATIEELEDIKETSEENNDIVEADKDISNKKKHNKKVLIILLVCVGVILILGLFLPSILESSKEKEDDIVDKKLTEKEMEELIQQYGEALEGVISIYYSKQNVILEYNDAIKLVEFDEEINCKVHDIYKDGKVYLNKCSVNGINTKYSYGEAQKEIESTDEILKVYVEKVSNKVSLEEPKGSTYDTYTVHCGSKYSDPEIMGDYVLYYDPDYVLHMKNYKTDEKVLKDLSYQAIWPIRIKPGIYDSTYLLVKISNYWGVYNYNTSVQVISPMYTSFLPFLGGSVGDTKAVDAIGNNMIAAWDGNNYGVINYTTNRTIIPFEYASIELSGDLIWAVDKEGNGQLYDKEGNKKLENTYQKVYGVVNGNNILIKDNDNIKLIDNNGTVKYDYGKLDNINNYSFGIYYNEQAIFQFTTKESEDKCMEVVYDLNTKEGSTKSITCGGIAKPVLYLYPENKTNVTITFSHPEYLETTYPKFINKWEVVADKDGNLTDKKGNNYYALYWDEKKVHNVDFNEGFYVEKDDAIKFLENKLSYIGLNDKERNEFIMYWLPILEKNKKSLVYFELTEERESYNKINIIPKPDSLLRLVIHVKKVDKKIDIKKQSLVKFKRRGFVAVEWGGTTY